MLIAAIAGFGFMAFVLSLPITDSADTSPIVLVLGVVLSGSLGAAALQIFNRSRDRVAVSADGIWYLPRTGAITFIAWSEVGSVGARDVAQRIVITDTTGIRRIRVEYQLEDFEKLRALVLRYSAGARLIASPATIFHRNWVNRGILLGSLVAFLLFTYLCIKQGQPGSAPIFLGLAVLSIVGLVREPARVKISNDSVVIKYLGWQRTVAFDAISNILLVDLHNRGNVVATVIIERRHGKPLKLMGFREGSIALNDALYSAWRAAGGVHEPSAASSAAVQSLTTFTGKPQGWLYPAILIAASIVPASVYSHLSGLVPRLQGPGLTLMWIPGVGAGIYMLSRAPRRLTIQNDSFTVEFLLRRWVVPYSTINNIELSEIRGARGNPVGVVKVERDGGRTLRLAGFREGAPVLYASLRAAWVRVRGEGEVVRLRRCGSMLRRGLVGGEPNPFNPFP